MKSFEFAVAEFPHINFNNSKAKEFPPHQLIKRYETYVKYCIDAVSVDGQWLEFGVCSGATAAEIIKMMPPDKHLYGFDWFRGLPEDWVTSDTRVLPRGCLFGTEARVIPQVERLKIIDGLFEETLPTFVEKHKENVAFLHVDCDLYNSTKTVFKYLKNQIVPGTVILFDELYNYPNYHLHEYKAFMEYVAENDINFEWIAYTAAPGQQAACKIL